MSDSCFKKMKEKLMSEKKAEISQSRLKLTGDLGKRKVAELTGSENQSPPAGVVVCGQSSDKRMHRRLGKKKKNKKIGVHPVLPAVKEEEEDDKGKVPLIVECSHTTDSSLEILEGPGDFAHSKLKLG